MKRIMKNITITKSIFLLLLITTFSCKDYLDVVPDNIATIEQAFHMRSSAEKYLFTCYSYMPSHGSFDGDPAILGGDEIWPRSNNLYRNSIFFDIAKGYQNVVSPYGDQWNNMYKALRDCNIFLDNIENVPDIDSEELLRWIAEVKVLKAYYHYYLIKMYGPIPLVKNNIPIDASPDEVKVTRQPVDECFDYVVQLLDEAAPDLPLEVVDPASELGRITRPIAVALKAKVLVTAASPLFNGDNDFAQLKNHDGTVLFNPEFQKAKWDSAAVACKEAIEVCAEGGFVELYKFIPSLAKNYSDTIITQLSIRNAMTERWNDEIIWGDTQSHTGDLQKLAQPWNIDPIYGDTWGCYGILGAPLKIAEMFYSKNGVPIDEDKTWKYDERYKLQVGGEDEKLYIEKGYTTAKLNFEREPRYYADLGFDGGIWYGQGRYDDSDVDNLLYMQAKNAQRNQTDISRGSITGYYIKKVIPYENMTKGESNYSYTDYPWPLIRLADIYLLYAEALNESEGPSDEVYKYLNMVRARAGLGTVQDSWTNYSTDPNKYKTKEGLRNIIQRERLIELAFEGQRFWDLKRWKRSSTELNKPITGWDIWEKTNEDYYVSTFIWNQQFGLKDYFWPIKDSYMEQNTDLVQNLGW